MRGKLYIVATPIGNLGDITSRAVEILRGCDIIAAENTQNSLKLLNKFEIRAKLVPNHKFNEQSICDYFLRELLSGKNIALISDAGTPCISDPGSLLVRKAVENNITVEGVPGACAAVTALSISGFDARTFSFLGFFPRETGEIKKLLQDLKTPGIYIFYESPKRIIKTLEAFAENLSSDLMEAQVCLCNDLTKKFERVYRGTPESILPELLANTAADKGEYTIILEITGAPLPLRPTPEISPEAILVDIMLKQGCTLKAAVKIAAAEYNKNELYDASLNLKKFITSIFSK